MLWSHMGTIFFISTSSSQEHLICSTFHIYHIRVWGGCSVEYWNINLLYSNVANPAVAELAISHMGTQKERSEKFYLYCVVREAPSKEFKAH